MNCHDVKPLLDAFLDGELDRTQRPEIAQHIESCPSCAAFLREREQLREAIRADMPYHRAPAGLRDQVRFALRGAEYLERRPYRPNWLLWGAAAAAIVFALAGALPFLERAHTRRQLVAEELLSAHERALLTHEIDVVSTDRHTVKPWFNGKLPFSPPVADLASDGFPLQGGRLDFAGGHAVAALVYARKLHRIDVFVWPTTASDPPAAQFDSNGYHEISWTRDGFVFAAISDLNREELSSFAQLLRAAH